MSVLSAGISINQLSIANKNQQLRDTISRLMTVFRRQISEGRLSLNKVIALLQTKNQNALMNYLMNNPVISRNLQGIQNDSEIIASIQAEQNALESDLANIQAEINYLGYSQTQGGTEEEKKLLEDKKKQMTEVQNKYNKLVDRAKGIQISTTNPITVTTSDIDARSQNINGGLNNNG